jgi:hypothetical protein
MYWPDLWKRPAGDLARSEAWRNFAREARISATAGDEAFEVVKSRLDEHRALLLQAGYPDVQILEERAKGWICGIAKKPSASTLKDRKTRGMRL